MPKLVAITCPSMLYSAIRELVALLTGRGPHRPVMLPTVSFQDADIRRTNEDRAAAISASPPVPAHSNDRAASQPRVRQASRPGPRKLLP
jgi:hypothetical protein